jgi:hypothetical protein
MATLDFLTRKFRRGWRFKANSKLEWTSARRILREITSWQLLEGGNHMPS